MESIEVGKPFPGPVPQAESAHMELFKDGLSVLIQMPGCSRAERQAFKKSFKHYTYFESSTPVPIAVWVFPFPKPFGSVDMTFNARIVRPEYISDYTDTTAGVKNAVTFYLIDGNILKAMKLVGLQPTAVQKFHQTIQKQIKTAYSQVDYNKYLSAIYQFTTAEIQKMGTEFKK